MSNWSSGQAQVRIRRRGGLLWKESRAILVRAFSCYSIKSEEHYRDWWWDDDRCRAIVKLATGKWKWKSVLIAGSRMCEEESVEEDRRRREERRRGGERRKKKKEERRMEKRRRRRKLVWDRRWWVFSKFKGEGSLVFIQSSVYLVFSLQRRRFVIREKTRSTKSAVSSPHRPTKPSIHSIDWSVNW